MAPSVVADGDIPQEATARAAAVIPAAILNRMSAPFFSLCNAPITSPALPSVWWMSISFVLRTISERVDNVDWITIVS